MIFLSRGCKISKQNSSVDLMKTLFAALNPQDKKQLFKVYLFHYRLQQFGQIQQKQTKKTALKERKAERHKGTKQTRNEKCKVKLLFPRDLN